MEQAPLVAKKPEENSLLVEQLQIERVPNTFYHLNSNSNSSASATAIHTSKMSNLEQTPGPSQNNGTSSSIDVIKDIKEEGFPSEAAAVEGASSVATKDNECENEPVLQENNSSPLVSNAGRDASPPKQETLISVVKDESVPLPKNDGSTLTERSSQDKTKPSLVSSSEAQSQPVSVPSVQETNMPVPTQTNKQSTKEAVAAEPESKPALSSNNDDETQLRSDNAVESKKKESELNTNQGHGDTVEAGVSGTDLRTSAESVVIQKEQKRNDVQLKIDAHGTDRAGAVVDEAVSQDRAGTASHTDETQGLDVHVSSASTSPDQTSLSKEDNSKESTPKESSDRVLETAPLETETNDSALSVVKETKETASVEAAVSGTAMEGSKDNVEKKDPSLQIEKEKMEEGRKQGGDERSEHGTNKDSSDERKDETKMVNKISSSQAMLSSRNDKQTVKPSLVKSSSADSDKHTTQTTAVSHTPILSQPTSQAVVLTTFKDTSTPEITITRQLVASSLSPETSSSELAAIMTAVSPLQQVTAASKPQPNLVPVIAHAPVLKTALKHIPVNVYKEQTRIATMGAEKLKVGEVEMLQPASDLHLQQKNIEVKSREEIIGRAPPQVAMIPPIIDLTKVSESRGTSEGMSGGWVGDGVRRRGSDGTGGGALIIEKQTNTTLMMQRKDDIKSQSDSDVKSSPHPVARRIWMSSCRPLDPASLERIGVDSKGNVYWYDGGKNMFLSPLSSDPAYKPSESELQLACKSMVQWTAKLKELRNSNTEEDIKLAQCIKDQFLNRVRVATQRKPRDISVLQKLQAVRNIRHPLASPALPQTAAATTVVSQSGGDASKATQLVPGAFPQGSILVVPHHGHPGFHAVLPVFANTAVIMQQSHAATSQVSSTQQQAPTSSGAGTQVSTVTTDVTQGTPQVALASSASVVQSSATPTKEGVPAKEKQNEKRQQQQPPTIALPPGVLPQALANTVFSQAALKYHPNYQHALALAGYSFPSFMSMKVEDAVQLSTVDFESKSIEITGEVPIKKIEINELRGLDERILTEGSEEQEELTVDRDDSQESNRDKAQEVVGKEADSEKQLNVATKLPTGKENEEGVATSFQGRSSTEVMSAKLLLSLTDGSHHVAKESSKVDGGFLSPPSSLKPVEESSPAGSAPHTPSSGRKRKQKPIASAKPRDNSFIDTLETTPASDSKPSAKGKRVRKPKQQAPPEGEQNKTVAKSPPKKRGKKQGKPASTQSKSKQFTPQELLAILDIPPDDSSTPSRPTVKTKPKQKATTDEQPLPLTSKASAKMEQLKASRTKKPMKEYVIETDSESDSSSSGSSSSRFSPNSGSSSDSSSESSSDNEKQSETEAPKTPQKKAPVRGRGGNRGRGRGRGRGRVAKGQSGPQKSSHSSSSGREESSSSDEEDGSSKKRTLASKRGTTGRGRGRRGGRGGAGRRPTGHIVRIPTSLLTTKPISGKKRKSISEKEIETDVRKAGDYGQDIPVDLATLYANKGGVDLGTLTELAKNLGASETEVVASRSKRTCVRVRQEITKLQEILKEDHSDLKPSPPSRGRGRGRGRGGVARSGDAGTQDSVGGSAAPVKKYRRPAYSQFTHKRRKRKKKQPEEEALWQPARKHGESLKPIYVFSTTLANKAAESVIINKYDNIIQFHQAQPKGPGFLRLPQDEKPMPPSISGRSARKPSETAELEQDKETSSGRGPRRRSARLSTEGSASTTTKRSGLRGRSPDEELGSGAGDEPSRSPQPFLRSSRRLRRQRNDSTGLSSPPPAHSPPSTTEHATKSPNSSPPSGSFRSRLARSSRSGAATQRSSRRRRRSSQDSIPKSPAATVSTESTAEDEINQKMEDDIAAPSQQEEQTFKDFEESDYQSKKLKLDESQQSQSSPGMQSPEQQPSLTQDTSDDVNYTICHGTPANKSPGIDVSSPRNWVQHQQQRHHAQMMTQQYLQQQQQVAGATHSPSAAYSHQIAAQSTRAAQPGDSRSGGQYPDGRGVRVNIGGEHFQIHQQQASSEQQQQAHRDANNWGAMNLASQFPGVPAGYPPVYNPGLHAAMSYPTHAGQAVHGANYPYPMPYPWGHHHTSQLASHGEHMIQHQQRQLKAQELSAHQSAHTQDVYQHARSAESLGQLAHGAHDSPSNLVLRQAAPTSQPSGSSSSAQKPPGMEKLSPQGHAPPPPTLHQFSSPGNASHSLSHHIPHGFSRPPHALTPEHLPPGGHAHPAFHYGFDAGAHSLSQMQMWQQSQMQAPPIRPIAGMHPSHLSSHMAHHGLWYPPSPMSQIMRGGEVPGITKKTTKGSKSSTGDKLSANQNSSNNNNQPVHPSQSVYPSTNYREHFPNSSGKNTMSPTNAAFSIEHLTNLHSKGDTRHGSLYSEQTARSSRSVTAGVPTSNVYPHTHVLPQAVHTHNPPRSFEEHFSTSALLERTRQRSEMGEMVSFPN